MKPRFSNQRSHALTLVEVLVVIAVLAVLVAMFLPALAKARRPSYVSCIGTVKQIGLSFRVWADDHNEKFPMQVSVANGGAMELIATGNVAACFQVMSNELSTPKLLTCPEDTSRHYATNFSTDLVGKISYFVGLDANTNSPQAFLSGDDNFEAGGAPVKSGLLELSTNSEIAWTSGRHISYKEHFWTPTHRIGNIGLADGSVQPDTSIELQQAFQQTALATNRLAIP